MPQKGNYIKVYNILKKKCIATKEKKEKIKKKPVFNLLTLGLGAEEAC